VCLTSAEVLLFQEDTFDDAVSTHENLLLAFTGPADVCEHCAELEEVLVEAAGFLEPQTKVGTIDGTLARALASEFQVQEYPTLFFLTSGQFHWYDGPGDLQGMISWVDAALEPLEELPELLPATDKGRLTLIGPHLPPAFTTLTRSVLRRFRGCFVRTQDAEDAEDAEERGRVVLQHIGEEPKELAPGWSDQELAEFVGAHLLPLVGAMKEDTYAEYERADSVIWVFAEMLNKSLDHHTEMFRPLLLPVAQSSSWKFAVFDTVLHGDATEMIIGVPRAEYASTPVMVAIKGGHRYKFTGNDGKELQAFLEQVDAGSVPYMAEPWSSWIHPVDAALYAFTIFVVVWAFIPPHRLPTWMVRAEYHVYSAILRFQQRVKTHFAKSSDLSASKHFL
jgi:thiol-disulfide isomerase/thioredoxin